DSRHVAEPLQRVRGKLVFVALDRLETGRGDVVDGGAESHRLGEGGRAGPELVREITPCRLLELNLPDHVAAEVERLHLFEQLVAAPQRAAPPGGAELVRREGEEGAARGPP